MQPGAPHQLPYGRHPRAGEVPYLPVELPQFFRMKPMIQSRSLCFFRLLALAWAVSATAMAASVPLLAAAANGRPVERSSIRAGGGLIRGWRHDGGAGVLTFKPVRPVAIPANGTLYLEITYLDQGYGRLNVQLGGLAGQDITPDRFLGLARSDSGKRVTARMRLAGVHGVASSGLAVQIGLDPPAGEGLTIESVGLQDTPFDDANFQYVISDPWQGPYQGPVIKPPDNSTLKGKIMAGYQGWFRTPNDPDGRGWVHWGDIANGAFNTDMWPDVAQYSLRSLDKAAAVTLQSGKPGYLFSSAWPDVVDTHFRWMREHGIDGAFLQRFVSDHLGSLHGGPERVLANVRAAANREGRIWAIEYDVSGYPDARLLETLQADWKWCVDTFGLLKDPNYAREGGKPVVFIWGLPFPDRNMSPQTANAVVDFFRNDPKYGGNYLIGGIPNNWRRMDPAWQEHIKKYQCVLPWMSSTYADDLTDFSKLGLAYYAHVLPGFSWANMKHLPTGDATVAYTPRDGGGHYWNQLSAAVGAGAERLFVGMFDEYDEGTAIMPMSDDTPLTPVRPGVGATFYNGPRAMEQGEFVLLPKAEIALGTMAPSQRTAAENFYVRLGGRIVFPTAGQYTFSVDGAGGDDAELSVNGKSILRVKGLGSTASASQSVTAVGGEAMPYRLEYRHGTGTGTLRLLWESSVMPRQPVPASALFDAWGRFITNEGKPSDWWLKLTRTGKELMLEKRKASSSRL